MSGIAGMTFEEIQAAVAEMHDSSYSNATLAVMLAAEERVDAQDMIDAEIDRESLCVALIEYGIDLHRINIRKS